MGTGRNLTAEDVIKASREWNEMVNRRLAASQRFEEAAENLSYGIQDPENFRYYVWPECIECLWMNCCNKITTRSASHCGNQVTKEQALARLNVSLLFALARKGRAG